MLVCDPVSSMISTEVAPESPPLAGVIQSDAIALVLGSVGSPGSEVLPVMLSATPVFSPMEVVASISPLDADFGSVLVTAFRQFSPLCSPVSHSAMVGT
jgi:hypothetical protein